VVGDAIRERICSKEVFHIPLEEMLPSNAVEEDLLRYKFISNHMRFLLYLIYRIPIFYYRKYFREKFFKTTDMAILKEKISTLRPNTVICVSHRPAFWLSLLKTRYALDFTLWGVLVEFGNSLGWKYMCWEAINGILSPVVRQELNMPLPKHVRYITTGFICHRRFRNLSQGKGDRNQLLLVAGFWGQMQFRKTVVILRTLKRDFPQIRLHVMCGINATLYKRLSAVFISDASIRLYQEVDTLYDVLKECASVITKPGYATIVQAYTAGRKIFLLKGMPVAEDHNARYATQHLGAEWFSQKRFKGWYFRAAILKTVLTKI